MVSKASEDLPLPLRPVITTNLSLGIETSMFFRLLTLAPVTSMLILLSLPKSFFWQLHNIDPVLFIGQVVGPYPLVIHLEKLEVCIVLCGKVRPVLYSPLYFNFVILQ